MGTYLNPGNSGFVEMLKSDYVDKTGLISIINSTIGTKKKLTCISRPRRFGKSYAAQMLCAYYDKTCDSHELFSKYAISKDKSYADNLNKYDVIYLDMTNLLGKTSPQKLVGFIQEKLIGEIKKSYDEVNTDGTLDEVLTLLTHLGYLTYEEEPDSYDDDTVAGLVKIPNEEVRSEFDKILRKAKHKSLIELVRKSDRLLEDTLEGKSDAVAKAIAEVHDSEYAPTYYSNEQSLRYIDFT